MQARVLIPVTNPLGGIRTYMLYNLRRLYDEGFRFTFLSERSKTFDLFKQDVVDWEGTQFIESPQSGGSRGAYKTIRQAIRTQHFDLIHSQGLRAGTEAGTANFFVQIPHLVTLHDVIVPQNDIPGRFKGLKKAIMSTVLRRASVLIPVTEDCRENHLALFPAWKKGPVETKTIVNGVDVDGLLESQASFRKLNNFSLRKELNVDSRTILGGFFGRFMPQKGFDLLLQSLALLSARGYRDRLCVVAAKDRNGYLNETIRDANADPDVARMIRFVEPIPHIAPLLDQCDLLVMPSRWEACGLLAMESMVLGKPVVGSNCIGLREVLAGTPSLVFETENPESLAERLIEFVENPIKKAAEDYAPTAIKRFDVKLATDKLLELYRRFVK